MTSLRKQTLEQKDIALIDILDVILDKGIAIKGDLLISIAGIDLVYLDLRVLISSVETLIGSHDRQIISSQQFEQETEALRNGK
ncbi:gas vesicle protein [Priestia aryabhattai]|uniref:Gas vesicle synthesis protein GvpA n=1 Tax=Priestia megaterium Q3 TaxID=1452722 RepID=A0A806U1U4_PRIMG|nr:MULTISPECIES: gas vesicle protein [Priestia]MCL9635526.1 gas vesicle protein [Bacillus zanthoxyli]AKP78286.1 gas vesicle synthesis protein GvpA [Priestia megaterium Q3]MBX9967554.1 gas vesicle protein [Priestia aryabhattai]MBY0074389.1 gas vesicle protein [Priestia aryabhattai]MBZ6486958.1 gas vesicle protein [Priestia aryabhattai]